MDNNVGGIFGGVEGSKTRTYIIVAIIAVLIIVLFIMMSDSSTASFTPRAQPGRGKMSVGAHWDQAGNYGNTPDILPASHAYSGYSQTVPTGL